MKTKKSLGLKQEFKFARAKKALGQNFLKSIPALNAIIKAGEISEEDIILEIGPGKGALTKKLLENFYPSSGGQGRVVAVEKDRELVEFLKNKFKKEIKNKKLILIEDDILDFNMKQVIKDSNSSNFSSLYPSKSDGLRHEQKIERVSVSSESKNLKSLRYKIIANIPYNITGAILKKFLTEENQPERMILMVQNEVAKRIVSKKESILSISVKAYGDPKIVMKVSARYFSPAPKVDSAIVAINNISRKIFKENNINEEKFWEIVKKGFAHKRKKLSGNLKNAISAEKLQKNNFKDRRAEELSLSDWILLAQN